MLLTLIRDTFTPAETLGDPVPDDEKQRRVDELMALQEVISLEKNQERIGKVYRCLIDRHEDGFLVGRTEYDSPEVDNEVLVADNPAGHRSGHKAVTPGNFVDVRITDATEHDLMGELIA